MQSVHHLGRRGRILLDQPCALRGLASGGPPSNSGGSSGPQTDAAAPEQPHHQQQQQQQPQQHWLDARFPAARRWLQVQARRWWVKGVAEASCK